MRSLTLGHLRFERNASVISVAASIAMSLCERSPSTGTDIVRTSGNKDRQGTRALESNGRGPLLVIDDAGAVAEFDQYLQVLFGGKYCPRVRLLRDGIYMEARP